MKAKPRGERGWWLERTRGFYLTDRAWEIRGTMAEWGEFYDGFTLADPVHVALWRLARLQRREIERLREALEYEKGRSDAERARADYLLEKIDAMEDELEETR